MQLVERHVISCADSRFAGIDTATFASKNLYNTANYVVRPSFIHDGVHLNYREMDYHMKDHEAYRALPAKVATWVLRILDKNWQSFFEALAGYEANLSKFLGRPKLSGYKDKRNGRNLLVYTIQAFSVPALRQGVLVPSKLGIAVQTQHTDVQQVRIVPRHGFCVVEVDYEQAPVQASVDPAFRAGVDIDINNLATLASDKPGFITRTVNGRPVKSSNQYYNKRRAELQSQLGPVRTSHHLEQLTIRRTRRINHYLHTASRRIIDLLIDEGIGSLVVGKNPLWKQGANLGRRTNQNFLSIPHARFMAMLRKFWLVGIGVLVTKESYTSKASFLDDDPLPDYDGARAESPNFSGRWVQRGLYRAADGRYINADVNGACNIIRKAGPNAFTRGSRGCVVHPRRLPT
jgi:putative transposase